MTRPRPDTEREAFRRWLADPERNMKSISETLDVPLRTVYDWRDRYGWEREEEEIAETVGKRALLAMRLKSGAAVDRLVSIVEDRGTRDQDAINAAKVLLAGGFGGFERGGPDRTASVYVDKLLVTETASLPTADLLKLAAGGLEDNISQAQQQRVSKRQAVPDR